MKKKLLSFIYGVAIFLPIVVGGSMPPTSGMFCEVIYDDGFERLEECIVTNDSGSTRCVYFYQNNELFYWECEEI